MDEPPVRKSARLASFNYLGFQPYFVTLCCFHRQKIFSDAEECRQVLRLLQSESSARLFAVHAYCAMSDHLHFLAEGTDASSDLLHFIKSFKIKSSRAYATRHPRLLWQTGYFEHILRAGESLEPFACYIWLNPVRKNLVSRPQEYALAGSFSGMKIPAIWSAEDWKPPWKRAEGKGR